LVKNQILGFVTIGKSVGNVEYDDELFNQIKSIASSIYISIVNAQYITEIKRQKEENQKKIDTIGNIIDVIKNISSCNDIEELSQITLSTMQLGFDYESVFIALKVDGKLEILDAIGFADGIEQFNGDILIPTEEFHYELTGENIGKYIKDEVIDLVDEPNCLVIAPIEVDKLTVDDSHIMGYIVALKSKAGFNQTNASIVDMIASSISPIVNKFYEAEDLKKSFIPNHKELFVKDVENALEYRNDFFIDFSVYYKVLSNNPFDVIDLDQYDDLKVRQIGNLLLLVSEQQINYDFDGQIEIEDMKDFYRQIGDIIT